MKIKKRLLLEGFLILAVLAFVAYIIMPHRVPTEGSAFSLIFGIGKTFGTGPTAGGEIGLDIFRVLEQLSIGASYGDEKR
jgi:hypothetical protein